MTMCCTVAATRTDPMHKKLFADISKTLAQGRKRVFSMAI